MSIYIPTTNLTNTVIDLSNYVTESQLSNSLSNIQGVTGFTYIQELVNKRPTSSSTPYMLDVNGSINCSTNFSCSGSSSTRSLTSSSGNLTLNNGRIYASNS